MPRDLSKNEDMTSKSNRYSPLGRRSSSETTAPPLTPPLTVPATTRPSEEQRRDLYVHPNPSAETSMSMFHAQVVEKLHERLENRELELDSDAETLTADEGSDWSGGSWSSRDSLSSHSSWGSLDGSISQGSWNSYDSSSNSVGSSSRDSNGGYDSSGNYYHFDSLPAPRTPEIFRQFENNTGPRVLVVPIPQLDWEPMEVVMDDKPMPISRLQQIYNEEFFSPAAAAAAAADDDDDDDDDDDAVESEDDDAVESEDDDTVESEDDDDASETSSYWQSDEDEEIQRASLEESDEESVEDHEEPNSGRVHRPQVDSPQYYVPHSQPPSPGSAQQVQPYLPVDQQEPPQGQLAPVIPQEQPAPVRENNVELMDQDDQDDQDSHYDRATSAALHSPHIRENDFQAQHHVHESNLYCFSRYEPGGLGLNNNHHLEGSHLPHPINRPHPTNNICTHCGLPRHMTPDEKRQIELIHRVYTTQLMEERSRTMSVQHVHHSEESQ